jgi:hypothetical protein
VDHFSDYFESLFSDIASMAEQLPNKIQEGMNSAVSSSLEDVQILKNILMNEFAVLKKEMTDLPTSICKRIPLC